MTERMRSATSGGTSSMPWASCAWEVMSTSNSSSPSRRATQSHPGTTSSQRNWAELPPGGRLGIYGFGASAHVVAQVAIAQGAAVHVLTRSPAARALALELGAASAGAADDAPPEPLDAAVTFAPVGELVPVAMRALDAGGTLAVAAST